MIVTQVNDWYMSTDTLMGSTDTSNITSAMIHNAGKIRSAFRSHGWSESAIAGMLGNMQLESTINPAMIQATHRNVLPNSGADLSDVPNNVMINFYGAYWGYTSGFGVGMVQWDGYTSTPPAGQKLVSFAERYNLNWYDGDTQVFRIKQEQATNIQWQAQTLYGVNWTWSNYVTNTETPERSAEIWMYCYEVSATGTLPTRQANARYWFDNPASAGIDPWMYFTFNRKKGVKRVKRVF